MLKTIATIIACAAIYLSGCGNDSDSEVDRVIETACTDPVRCPGTEMVTPHHVSKVAPTTMPEGYKRSPEFSDRVDFDNDGDPASHDCDDHDAGRRHALAEVACDGIDQNCDGQDDCDRGQTISPAAANQPTPEPPGPKRTL